MSPRGTPPLPACTSVEPKYSTSSTLIEEIRGLYEALDERVNKLAEDSDGLKGADGSFKLGSTNKKVLAVMSLDIGDLISEVPAIPECTPVSANTDSSKSDNTDSYMFDNNLSSDIEPDTPIKPFIDPKISSSIQLDTPCIEPSIDPKISSSIARVFAPESLQVINSGDLILVRDQHDASKSIGGSDGYLEVTSHEVGNNVNQISDAVQSVTDTGTTCASPTPTTDMFVKSNAATSDKLQVNFYSISTSKLACELSPTGIYSRDVSEESITSLIDETTAIERSPDIIERTHSGDDTDNSGLFKACNQGVAESATPNNFDDNSEVDILLDRSFMNFEDFAVDLEQRQSESRNSFTSAIDTVADVKQGVVLFSPEDTRDTGPDLARDIDPPDDVKTFPFISPVIIQPDSVDAKTHPSVSPVKILQDSVEKEQLLKGKIPTFVTPIWKKAADTKQPNTATNKPTKSQVDSNVRLGNGGRDKFETVVVDIKPRDDVTIKNLSNRKMTETWTFTTDYTFIIPTKSTVKANGLIEGDRWASDGHLSSTATVDKHDSFSNHKPKEKPAGIENTPVVVNSVTSSVSSLAVESCDRCHQDVTSGNRHKRSRSADASVQTELVFSTNVEPVGNKLSIVKTSEETLTVREVLLVVDAKQTESNLVQANILDNNSHNSDTYQCNALDWDHKATPETTDRVDSKPQRMSDFRATPMPSVRSVLIVKPLTTTSRLSENQKISNQLTTTQEDFSKALNTTSIRQPDELKGIANEQSTSQRTLNSLNLNTIDPNTKEIYKEPESTLIVKEQVTCFHVSESINPHVSDSRNNTLSKYKLSNYGSSTTPSNIKSENYLNTITLSQVFTQNHVDFHSVSASEDKAEYRKHFETPGDSMASTLITSMFSKSELSLNNSSVYKKEQRNQNSDISTDKRHSSSSVAEPRPVTHTQQSSSTAQNSSAKNTTEKEKKQMSSPKLGRKLMTFCPVEIDIEKEPASTGPKQLQKPLGKQDWENQNKKVPILQQIQLNEAPMLGNLKRINTVIIVPVTSSSEASKPVEKLKGILANARPRAPPSSFVESSWNGGALIAKAKSEGKSLHNLSQLELFSDKVPIWRGGDTKQVATPTLQFRSIICLFSNKGIFCDN